MSFAHYIPVIWESALLSSLKKSQVYLNLCNNNVKVTDGKSVKIISVDDVTVGSYTGCSDVTFQTPQDSEQTFIMDQDKYFALNIDNIDAFQMVDYNAMRAELMKNSAYAISDSIDQFIAAKYADAGIKEGTGNSALGTEASPLDISADGNGSTVKSSIWLSRLARRMDDNNVPGDNRQLVVPPWLMQKFVLEKLTAINDTMNEETYARGRVARIMGFDIMVSNNVNNNDTNYRCMADVPAAIAFHKQIEKIDVGSKEKQFGDYMKGLVVYGAKVIRADALASSVLTEGTEA